MIENIFDPFLPKGQKKIFKIDRLLGPESKGNLCLMNQMRWDSDYKKIKKDYAYH